MFASYVPIHLTDPLWKRLANARLFITGGTGLFGHWLLDSLSEVNQRLNLNIEATVLTRNPDLAKARMSLQDHRISFIKGNVENFSLPKEKFDVILHMANTSAEETFLGSSQIAKLKLLYKGTQKIIELADSSGAGRILFTSSGAVYGNQLCDHIQESTMIQIDPLKADSGLALGKSVAEFLLSQARAELSSDIVIARCFAFVGPGMPLNLHYAIGNFIKNVTEGKAIVIKGDGTDIRSYMYMGDLVWWLLKILLDGKSGEVYNVGSDQPISIFELAQKIAQHSIFNSQVVVQGQVSYSVGIAARKVYVPSIDKASSFLGLRINTDLNAGISKTLNSLRIKSI